MNTKQLIKTYERIRDNGTFDEAAYYNPFLSDLRQLDNNEAELLEMAYNAGVKDADLDQSNFEDWYTSFKALN